VPPRDRYQILGQIASGGMAEIYLAHLDTRSHGAIEVVLKRLKPELQSDEEFVEMFYDEARIASQMDHPNIARIYELGELDGSLFIAMELVPGATLRDILTRLRLRSERIPVEIMLRIGSGALEALSYAHARTDESGRPLNIVHRDVSPQNILISYEGDVKLLDFGVAKAERKFHKTLPGLVKGKFAYMAPEQIKGDHLDGRADLFALGETLYESSLLLHPFVGSNDAAVLSAIMQRPPIPPTDIDPHFPPIAADILLRALSKDRDQRPESARQMKEMIDRFLGGSGPSKEDLARWVSTCFSDALGMLKESRITGRTDLLVRSMRVEEFASSPEPDAPSQTGHYSEVPTLDIPRQITTEDSDDINPFGSSSSQIEPRKLRPHGVFDESISDENELPISTRARKIREETPDGVDVSAFGSSLRSRTIPPRTRLGRYVILDHLRTTTTAEHFLARADLALGLEKDVVLKRVIPELARDRDAIEALVREGRLLLRLPHPSIVQLIDAGTYQSEPFLALEHVDGWSLREILDQCKILNREIPAGLACRIASDLLAAVFSMHTAIDSEGEVRPIVHRDLCPEAVVVSKQGAVRLRDLDAALPGDQLDRRAPVRRQSGLAYVAPESSMKTDIEDVRGDIYAVGAIFLEALLVDHVSKANTTFEHIMESAQDEEASSDLPLDPDDPAALVAMRSTSRSPRERYGSAHAFQVDVERVLLHLTQPVTSQHLASWLQRLFARS
jgi:serine/threonine protein kinase